jgi:hypothetical protein
MSSLPDTPLAAGVHARAVVAEVVAGKVSKAHLIPTAMAGLGRHAVTVCGFPFERLQMMPSLDWTAVDPAARCEHCEASAQS